MFLGVPDDWFEPSHFICPNGHVSGRYLKSEMAGPLCFVCFGSVKHGPKISEDEMRQIVQDWHENTHTE